MKYEEFNDASYTQFRRTYLSRDLATQLQFLMQLRLPRAEFCEWFADNVSSISGERLPLLPNPLTEGEFKQPPKLTEAQIYDKWSDLTPAISCRVSFWALVTFRHIAEGLLEPSYLASGRSDSSRGAEHIDQLIQSPETQVNKIDEAVRATFRRLGGLPEARGNRSVYVNCPLARAWWRGYLAVEICKDIRDENQNKETKKYVIDVFRQSQTYWEGLINLVVSKGSVLGDFKVRNALVLVLAQRLAKSKDAFVNLKLDKAETLERFRQAIGIRSAWQELGVFSIEDLEKIIKKIIDEEIIGA